jgi:hypothetical protein
MSKALEVGEIVELSSKGMSIERLRHRRGKTGIYQGYHKGDWGWGWELKVLWEGEVRPTRMTYGYVRRLKAKRAIESFM